MKGDPSGTSKNFRKKSHQTEKKSKGGPFSLVRFCMLRLKKEKLKGTRDIVYLSKNFEFRGIRTCLKEKILKNE